MDHLKKLTALALTLLLILGSFGTAVFAAPPEEADVTLLVPAGGAGEGVVTLTPEEGSPAKATIAQFPDYSAWNDGLFAKILKQAPGAGAKTFTFYADIWAEIPEAVYAEIGADSLYVKNTSLSSSKVQPVSKKSGKVYYELYPEIGRVQCRNAIAEGKWIDNKTPSVTQANSGTALYDQVIQTLPESERAQFSGKSAEEKIQLLKPYYGKEFYLVSKTYMNETHTLEFYSDAQGSHKISSASFQVVYEGNSPPKPGFDVTYDGAEAPNSAVLKTGGTLQLIPQLLYYPNYAGGVKDDKVIWTSADETVAAVDYETGEVKAVGPGETTITARTLAYWSEVGKPFTVQVLRPVAVEGVSLDQESMELEVGKTGELIAAVKPENADNQSLLWSSENDEIAAVEDGVVSALSVGNTKIIVETEDGHFKAACDVTVKEAPSQEEITADLEPELPETVERGDDVTLQTALPQEIIDGILETAESGKDVTLILEIPAEAVGKVLDSGAATVCLEMSFPAGFDAEDILIEAIQAVEEIFTQEGLEDASLIFSISVEGSEQKSYSWEFEAGSIDPEKAEGGVNLALNLDGKTFEGKTGAMVDLSHNGILPLKPGKSAKIKIYVGDIAAVKNKSKLALYYWDEENSKWVKEKDPKVLGDGYVAIQISHCSKYMLVPAATGGGHKSSSSSSSAGGRVSGSSIIVEYNPSLKPWNGETGPTGGAIMADTSWYEMAPGMIYDIKTTAVGVENSEWKVYAA